MTAPAPISRRELRERLAALCRSGVGPGLPRKRRDAHILLRSAAGTLPVGAERSEAEVNRALDGWLAAVGERVELDRVALRRALVDHRYLERDPDGSVYRRGPGMPSTVSFGPGVEDVDAGEVVREARERNERKRRERGG